MPIEFPSAALRLRIETELPAILEGTYRPFIAPFSKTLARELKASVISSLDGESYEIEVGHGYWWGRVLDTGRKAFFGNEFLIWFRDVRDDPRVGGGTTYPRTYQAARKLTTAEYEEGLKQNREAYRTNAPPFMLVRPNVAGFSGYQYSEQATGPVNLAFNAFMQEAAVADMREEVRRAVREAGF